MKRSFESNGGVMASLLAKEHAHCTRARSGLRHARKQKKEKLSFLSFSTQSRGRTGTGVNLLVFETSASTDSAIWASDFSEMVCKYRNYFLTSKIFMHFFSLSSIFGAVLLDAYTPYIVIMWPA